MRALKFNYNSIAFTFFSYESTMFSLYTNPWDNTAVVYKFDRKTKPSENSNSLERKKLIQLNRNKMTSLVEETEKNRRGEDEFV